MTDAVPLSIILPAHDEADWIEACLAAVLASDPVGAPVEIIVVANGCRDDTERKARAMGPQAEQAGMQLTVLDLPEGGKTGALNAGDAVARFGARIYLDADVRVSAGLLRALARALQGDGPRYASGTPLLSTARSGVSHAYGRFWMTLPFNTEGVPGYGLFAMNGAGRARWGDWPEVISDDTFARLNFAPGERVKLKQSYEWPLVEGFGNLVRVRRRQDQGVAEIAARYPQLTVNDGVSRPGAGVLLARAAAAPLGFLAYAAVALAVRLGSGQGGGWVRGR